jgi:hypothetical protein
MPVARALKYVRAMASRQDWTSAWTGAAALAISSWTRDPTDLADPESRRLLELALEIVVRREGLILHAYVILPGALHLVTGAPGPAQRLPWPIAVGRVKSCHAGWERARRGSSGAIWRSHVRVQPMASEQVSAAVARLHEAPMSMGLATSPADWDASSWAGLYRSTRPGFVSPWGAVGTFAAPIDGFRLDGERSRKRAPP